MKAFVEVVAEQVAETNAARPGTPSRPRKGELKTAKTGRAARIRVGHHMSRARRLDVLGRLALRLNTAAGVVTVADELRARGADTDLIRRYASPVGRKVAASFRAATSTEPQQIGLAVIGIHLGRAFGYGEDDRATVASVIDAYETKTPVRARLLDLIAERTEAAR